METNQQSMSNKSSFFGWPAVFQLYTLKDFLKDSIYPVIFSAIVMTLSIICDVESYTLLGKTLNIGLTIVPVMLSLLIAAYAILLSMFCSNTGKTIANQNGGKELLDELNSDFATSIFSSFIGILFFIGGSLIHQLKFDFIYADFVNYSALFLSDYLLFFSVFILKDLVIGIFNIGRVATHFQE